jgi:peptide/nickel transport system permease protein
VLAFVVLVAIFAPLVATHDPNRVDIAHRYAKWSAEHWLGTDGLGRDVFSRLVYGARTSVGIAFAAVGLALLVAIPVGTISGYAGGRFDFALMRVFDAMLSIPLLIAVLGLAVALGPSARTTIIALGLGSIPAITRLTRNEALARRSDPYVEAARLGGLKTPRIIWRHVVPNIRSPLLIAASFWVAAGLLGEAGLSYLGAGVQPPTASWGSMIRQAVDQALFSHPVQIVVPGVAITLTILAANLLGEGLRDAFSISSQGSRAARRRGRGAVPKASHGATAVAISAVAATERDTASSTPAPRLVTVAEPRLLAVEDLSIDFITANGTHRVVDNLGFSIGRGETLGLVGESGSGKTVTAMAIMRLLPSPPALIAGGTVAWKGNDLLTADRESLRQVRGNEIAIVFQNPMTSLDPSFTIEHQLSAACRAHQPLSRQEARSKARQLLDLVEIPAAERRLRDYPHQLSGGMLQRVMIAMALSCEPDLLIADEATTALDVTVQAGILALLNRFQQDLGLSILMISHDLGVIGEVCSRVMVMYAGQIVEENTTDHVFDRPRHPYTEGLLRANPELNEPGSRLLSIPGVVPHIGEMPKGCRFGPRCPYHDVACTSEIALTTQPSGARVRCVRSDALTLEGAT